MSGYAIVRDERVVNVIEWDGSTPFAVGAGEAIVPVAEAAADAEIAGGPFLPELPDGG